MMKRLFWFVVGVCAGVYGARQVRRASDGIAERLTMESLVNAVLSTVRRVARWVSDMVSGTGPDNTDRTVV